MSMAAQARCDQIRQVNMNGRFQAASSVLVWDRIGRNGIKASVAVADNADSVFSIEQTDLNSGVVR